MNSQNGNNTIYMLGKEPKETIEYTVRNMKRKKDKTKSKKKNSSVIEMNDLKEVFTEWVKMKIEIDTENMVRKYLKDSTMKENLK